MTTLTTLELPLSKATETTVRGFGKAAAERERDCRVGLRERPRNEEVIGVRGSREVGETEAEMRRLRIGLCGRPWLRLPLALTEDEIII